MLKTIQKEDGQYIIKGSIFETQFCFFGSRHSYAPEDSQWDMLSHEWDEFLQARTQSPVVILEGTGSMPFADVEGGNLIRRFGEMGYMAKKALDANARIIWNEMTVLDEAKILKKSYSEMFVDYFVFARSAGGWLRARLYPSFSDTLQAAARATGDRLGVDTSLDYYANLHQLIFNKPLDESQQVSVERAGAPIFHDSVINEISRQSGVVRDQKLFDTISAEIKAGNSVFVVYGAHHARELEAELRKLEE